MKHTCFSYTGLPVVNSHLIRPVDAIACSVADVYLRARAVQARAHDLMVALIVPEQVSVTHKLHNAATCIAASTLLTDERWR